MKKKAFTIVLFLLTKLIVYPQAGNFNVKEWISGAQTPYIVYISGDGGFNRFSTGLCSALNKENYGITAINARSYFWEKKKPDETALEVSAFLNEKIRNRKNQEFILVGYSFGAEVIPFIVNRLPFLLKKKLVCVVLLSPSTTTDFEIHWSDLLGGNKKRSMDVVAEINRMGSCKTVTIFGSNENEFPVKSVKLVNYRNEILTGGHHYDRDFDEVAKTIIKYFK